MGNAPSFPARKPARLQDYDYSQNGCYFVTVCVKDRRPILSTIVGGDALIAPQIRLTEIGKITEKHIQKINSVYTDVTVEKYIIMPDHIHLLLFIDGFGDGTMKASSPYKFEYRYTLAENFCYERCWKKYMATLVL